MYDKFNNAFGGGLRLSNFKTSFSGLAEGLKGLIDKNLLKDVMDRLVLIKGAEFPEFAEDTQVFYQKGLQIVAGGTPTIEPYTVTVYADKDDYIRTFFTTLLQLNSHLNDDGHLLLGNITLDLGLAQLSTDKRKILSGIIMHGARLTSISGVSFDASADAIVEFNLVFTYSYRTFISGVPELKSFIKNAFPKQLDMMSNMIG